SNNSFELSALTTQGLPTKFFSTNTEVARIDNGNTLVILRSVGEAEIMAYQEGDANVAPSDTIMVMRVSNFSLITALGEDLEKAFSLYPNPATDKVNLQTAIEVKQIEIYNSLGQVQALVWQNKGSEIEIETKNLAKGVYMFRVHTPLGVAIKRVRKL
ncbi:MAG: T9SS type A sorting domain-containing protein, partial [Raineya sp.]